MTTELLPCPFCGSSASICGGVDDAYVQCNQCTAEGPIGDFTDDQAAEAWNRRASPWKPISEAICDDRDVLVYLDNSQTCGQFVFNFDHDSDAALLAYSAWRHALRGAAGRSA